MTPDTWTAIFASLERIISIREIKGNFDSCIFHEHTSQNFRLYHGLNLSVLNFPICLLMCPGGRRRRAGPTCGHQFIHTRLHHAADGVICPAQQCAVVVLCTRCVADAAFHAPGAYLAGKRCQHRHRHPGTVTHTLNALNAYTCTLPPTHLEFNTPQALSERRQFKTLKRASACLYLGDTNLKLATEQQG